MVKKKEIPSKTEAEEQMSKILQTQSEKKVTEQEKIAELQEQLVRMQAEFENYKKHSEKIAQQHKEQASAHLIKNLLPIIDSFQEALKHTSKPEEFMKGVELIYSQLMTQLEKEGLRPIESINKPLDPFKHEVMLQEETDKTPGTIIEELQKGYTLKGCVIRYSKVKVSKEKQEDKNVTEN